MLITSRQDVPKKASWQIRKIQYTKIMALIYLHEAACSNSATRYWELQSSA